MGRRPIQKGPALAENIVTATVATTHEVEKYGGVHLTLEQLEEMRDKLADGKVPMVNNHSALQGLSARNVDARVEETEDGEHALVVDFEIPEAQWEAVEQSWKSAGASGGFSVAVTGLQEELAGPSEKPIIISADAAAYSDEARAEAGRLLSEAGSVEVRRLYQFGSTEMARVALDLLPQILVGISSGLFTHAIVEALGGLVRTQPEPSVIELRMQEKEGIHKTAVITTNDPEIVRAAIESLDQAASSDVAVQQFDATRRLWLPPGTGGN